MIRINLLPVPKARKSEALIIQGALGILGLLAIALACFFVSAEKKSTIADIQRRMTEKQREIDDLKAKVGEVDKFKKQVQTLESQLAVIHSLEKGRSGPVRMMDEFTGTVPRKLWVTLFRENNKKVSIEGLADSGPTIADFMDNLKGTKHFKSMQLSNVTASDFQGAKVHKFVITGLVAY